MEDRRDFLKTSAAFMGALAAFGLLPDNVLGQVVVKPLQATAPRPNANAKTLQLVIDDAVKAGDIGPALEKHKAEISPAQEEALRKLTKDDIAAIARMRRNLDPSKLPRADGNVIF